MDIGLSYLLLVYNSTRIFLLYKFIFLKLLPPLTEVFDCDSSSDPAG